MRRAARAAVPLLLVAFLLGLAAVAASFSSLQVGELDPPQQAPADLLPSLDEPPPQAPQPPLPEDGEHSTGWPWVGDVVLAAWLVAGLIGLVLLVRALARRRGRGRGGPRLRQLRRAVPASGPGPEDEGEVLAALDAGLEELSDDDQDPRRAVIACWVRLAEAASAAGVPRYPTDTAGDLVVRLLRAHQISEPVLALLAEVYRRARYASHDVDEQMRTQARNALWRLRDELGVERVGAAGGGAQRDQFG